MRIIVFLVALAALTGSEAGPARAADMMLALARPGVGDAVGAAAAAAGRRSIRPVSEGPNWACEGSVTRENTCCLNTKRNRAWCVADAETCHNAGGGVLPADKSVPSDVINDCKWGVDSSGHVHTNPGKP